jgi:hypothetical protein
MTVPVPRSIIDIPPEIWYRAGWRRLEPLPLPAVVPFDLDACLKRLEALPFAKDGAEWANLQISPALSPEEARFWLLAMTQVTIKSKFAPVLKKIAKAKFTDTPPLADIMIGIAANNRFAPELSCVLTNLLTPDEFCTFFQKVGFNDEKKTNSVTLPQLAALAEGVLHYVRPYLSKAKLDSYQSAVRRAYDTQLTTAQTAMQPEFRGLMLARVFDVQPEVDHVIAGLNMYHLSSYLFGYSRFDTFQILGGASSPSLLVTEMERLTAQPKTIEDVLTLFAHFDTKILDVLRKAMLQATSIEQAGELVEGLGRMATPEIALFLMELIVEGSKCGPAARRWLDSHLEVAVAGLILKATERGKFAEAAMDWLRDANRAGHRAIVDAELAKQAAPVGEKIRKALDTTSGTSIPEMTTPPDWLAICKPEGKLANFGTWIEPAALPTLIIDGQRTPNTLTPNILHALRQSTLEKPHDAVKKLKEHAEPRSCETLAWELFERWQAGGAPGKEKWAMASLGLIGGDGVCLKLKPLIREWPSNSLSVRAQFGLECLRAIGSEQALMVLHFFSEKAKTSGLKEKAKQFMEEIAKEKGLTQEQLQDRIVPDLGLDERGQRLFDFGPRQFRATIGPDLKHRVIDEKGDVKKDLPKPGKTDDPSKAEVAAADWKVFKKQIKDVLDVQSAKLEKALKGRRFWSKADFETYLVKHPFMGCVAQTLLWAEQPGLTKVEKVFRINEDRQLVDANGDPVTLSDNAPISIVHPILISEADLKTWQQTFADYEIMQPFTQLMKRLVRLTPEQQKAKEWAEVQGIPANRMKIIGMMKKLEWQYFYGQGEEGGNWKDFPEANVTAVIGYKPAIEMYDYSYSGYGGGGDPTATNELTTAYFVKRAKDSYKQPSKEAAVELGSVDPVILNEVCGTMFALSGASK